MACHVCSLASEAAAVITWQDDPCPKLQTPTQALTRPITIQFFGFPTQTLAKLGRNAPCAETPLGASTATRSGIRSVPVPHRGLRARTVQARTPAYDCRPRYLLQTDPTGTTHPLPTFQPFSNHKTFSKLANVDQFTFDQPQLNSHGPPTQALA